MAKNARYPLQSSGYKLVSGNFIMRQILLFSILTFVTFVTVGQNEIDKIGSSKQVCDFMVKKFPKFNYFNVTDTNYILSRDTRFHRIADSLRMKFWYKADFDKNDYTDLFAYAKSDGNIRLTYAMAFENNVYSSGSISKYVLDASCYFPTLDSVNTTPIIKLYYTKSHPIKDWPRDTAEDLSLYVDTLIFKFGDFIEYYPNHSSPDVDFAVFKPGENYSIDYTLKVYSDGKTFYNGIKNTKLKGKYKSTLVKNKREDLFNLINYIDFRKVRNQYASNWTDLSSISLSIHYKTGDKKEIFDYGLCGTFALRRLYELLLDIKEQADWK